MNSGSADADSVMRCFSFGAHVSLRRSKSVLRVSGGAWMLSGGPAGVDAWLKSYSAEKLNHRRCFTIGPDTLTLAW